MQKQPVLRATMLGVPGDAARRRGLHRVLFPLVFMSFFIGLGVGLMGSDALGTPWWVGFLVTFIAFLCLLYFCKQIPQAVYGFFKGARGEEMVASELARLPSTWTIFNGLILPDGRDVDHVAVGPQGVFVIETKHWRGTVDIENNQLLAEGRPLPEGRSPMLQVQKATAGVALTLQVPKTKMFGVLCFAGTQFVGSAYEMDEMIVCSYLNLETLLCDRDIVLDDAERARIIASLNTLTITEGL